MKKMFNSYLMVAFCATLVIAPTKSMSQTPPPPSGIPGIGGSGTLANGDPVSSPSVPFDGGLSLVLAASGIGYVSKKLKG